MRLSPPILWRVKHSEKVRVRVLAGGRSAQTALGRFRDRVSSRGEVKANSTLGNAERPRGRTTFPECTAKAWSSSRIILESDAFCTLP